MEGKFCECVLAMLCVPRIQAMITMMTRWTIRVDSNDLPMLLTKVTK